LNADTESPHFDLKFTLKSTEIKFPDLLPHQTVNHFSKASAICTKAGLLSTLRGAHNYAATHDRLFAPRSYDLGDPSDYVDFVDEFRAVEAERIVRSCVVRVLDAALASGAVKPEELRLRLGDDDLLPTDSRPDKLPGTAQRPYERALYSADASASTAALDRASIHRFLGAAGCPGANLGVLEAALAVMGRRSRSWDDDELDAPVSAVVQPVMLSASEWEVRVRRWGMGACA
jgi:hypothetical protein